MTRRIWIPLAVSSGVLILGALGLWAIWHFSQPALRERILSEARIRGFELDMEDFSVAADRVELMNATVRPIGVGGIGARADKVTLSLSGLGWRTLFGGDEQVTLTAVDVQGADVHVLGSAPALALELSRWSEQYPIAYDLPAKASQVALAWRATSDEEPWLLIARGQVERDEHGSTFHAAEASVLQRRVGPVSSTWSKQDGRIAMGFGALHFDDAPVRLEVLLDQPEPAARIELRRTPLNALTGALGITLPIEERAREQIQVEAKAELRLPPSMTPTPVDGSIQVVLLGFIPPHPPELQGFLFGDRTTFDTRLRVSADQSQVELTETRLTAGSFQLQGDGLVQRMTDHAEVHLRLQEALPCKALASAAADTRLGKHWASLTRQLIQTYMEGSVRVMVQVQADTRDLAGAKVTQTIGVGCGLQPLRPPTKEELESFTKQLPGLISELPKPALPALPGKLPELPRLPSLPTALPRLPSELPRLPDAPATQPPAE